jgi:hypothetical protein
MEHRSVTMTVRCLAVLGLALLMAFPAHAEKKPKPPKGKKESGPAVTLAFTTKQRESAQGFYAEKYGRGNCPPGLAKKQNGCLPPGQAKKRYALGQPLGPGIPYAPVPPELSVRIGAPPEGYLYVTLDGDLLKLAVGTLLVIDAVEGLVS